MRRGENARLLHEWHRAVRAEAVGAPIATDPVGARVRRLCQNLLS